jgi:CheY-like chemotaxis protein
MLHRNELSARQFHAGVIQRIVSVERVESPRTAPDPLRYHFGTSPVFPAQKRRVMERIERILVVDDEQPVRDALAALLRQEGYRVIVAESGHTAVEAIEAFTFDFLIVDIFMPGMNGLETIKVFRADAPDVPIITMSGYASGCGFVDTDFFRTAMDYGATCCLRKPFNREQLLDAIAFCRATRTALVA